MRATKSHDVMNCLWIHFEETVSYKLAEQVRQELLDSDVEA